VPVVQFESQEGVGYVLSRLARVAEDEKQLQNKTMLREGLGRLRDRLGGQLHRNEHLKARAREGSVSEGEAETQALLKKVGMIVGQVGGSSAKELLVGRELFMAELAQTLGQFEKVDSATAVKVGRAVERLREVGGKLTGKGLGETLVVASYVAEHESVKDKRKTYGWLLEQGGLVKVVEGLVRLLGRQSVRRNCERVLGGVVEQARDRNEGGSEGEVRRAMEVLSEAKSNRKKQIAKMTDIVQSLLVREKGGEDGVEAGDGVSLPRIAQRLPGKDVRGGQENDDLSQAQQGLPVIRVGGKEGVVERQQPPDRPTARQNEAQPPQQDTPQGHHHQNPQPPHEKDYRSVLVESFSRVSSLSSLRAFITRVSNDYSMLSRLLNTIPFKEVSSHLERSLGTIADSSEDCRQTTLDFVVLTLSLLSERDKDKFFVLALTFYSRFPQNYTDALRPLMTQSRNSWLCLKYAYALVNKQSDEAAKLRFLHSTLIKMTAGLERKDFDLNHSQLSLLAEAIVSGVLLAGRHRGGSEGAQLKEWAMGLLNRVLESNPVELVQSKFESELVDSSDNYRFFSSVLDAFKREGKERGRRSGGVMGEWGEGLGEGLGEGQGEDEGEDEEEGQGEGSGEGVGGRWGHEGDDGDEWDHGRERVISDTEEIVSRDLQVEWEGRGGGTGEDIEGAVKDDSVEGNDEESDHLNNQQRAQRMGAQRNTTTTAQTRPPAVHPETPPANPQLVNQQSPAHQKPTTAVPIPNTLMPFPPQTSTISPNKQQPPTHSVPSDQCTSYKSIRAIRKQLVNSVDKEDKAKNADNSQLLKMQSAESRKNVEFKPLVFSQGEGEPAEERRDGGDRKLPILKGQVDRVGVKGVQSPSGHQPMPSIVGMVSKRLEYPLEPVSLPQLKTGQAVSTAQPNDKQTVSKPAEGVAKPIQPELQNNPYVDRLFGVHPLPTGPPLQTKPSQHTSTQTDNPLLDPHQLQEQLKQVTAKVSQLTERNAQTTSQLYALSQANDELKQSNEMLQRQLERALQSSQAGKVQTTDVKLSRIDSRFSELLSQNKLGCLEEHCLIKGYSSLSNSDKEKFMFDLKFYVLDNRLCEFLQFEAFCEVLHFVVVTSIDQNTNADSASPVLHRLLHSVLDSLLKVPPKHFLLWAVVRLIRLNVPAFDTQFSEEGILYLKLSLKIAKKVIELMKKEVVREQLSPQQVAQMMKQSFFQILTEVFLLFVKNPPEELSEHTGQLEVYEEVFREVKLVSDEVSLLDAGTAKVFVEVYRTNHGQVSFIQYLESLLTKREG
jgi:hypothetical protein